MLLSSCGAPTGGTAAKGSKMETIETKRLRIRPVGVADVGGVFKIYSSPRVCEFFDLLPFQDSSQAQAHVERWLRLAGEKRQFRHAIILEEQLVGTCGLYSVSAHHRRASIGFDLLPACWERGIMTEALQAYVPYCLKTYGLSRIQAVVLSGSGASIRLLEKLGFQREGTLRKYEHWEGKGLVEAAVAQLGEGALDAGVCIMALMDMPAVAPLFCAIHRILRPGGRLVFVTAHPVFGTPDPVRTTEVRDDAGALSRRCALRTRARPRRAGRARRWRGGRTHAPQLSSSTARPGICGRLRARGHRGAELSSGERRLLSVRSRVGRAVSAARSNYVALAGLVDPRCWRRSFRLEDVALRAVFGIIPSTE